MSTPKLSGLTLAEILLIFFVLFAAFVALGPQRHRKSWQDMFNMSSTLPGWTLDEKTRAWFEL